LFLPRFGYLRPSLIAAAVGFGVVLLAAALVPKGVELQKEGGVLESLSVLLWALAAAIAFGATLRKRLTDDRWLAFWMGCIAVLAGLRELDLHVWLNPDHLGSWGVRFRLDWWLGGAASPWFKLGWASVFLGLACLMVYPPLRLRRELLQRLRVGEVVIGLLGLAVIFLALGFIIDDILRPVRFLGHNAKQLIEETSELVGAAFYAASSMAQWRRPAPDASMSGEIT
jgi:hypothetical protein